MIKRAIIVGLGAIVGMRIAKHVKETMRKQMHQKMREHCKQMTSQCKEMASDLRDRQPTTA